MGLSDELNSALSKPSEVLPSSYAVVKSRATEHKPDQIISTHTDFADALNAHNKAGAGHHLYAVYPDKSAKTYYSTGEESGGYNVYFGRNRRTGEFLEHTPHTERPYVKEYEHNADAAKDSLHRLTQRLQFVASSMLRGSEVKAAGIDTGEGSLAHSLLSESVKTGDTTPLLVLADHFEENGAGRTGSLIRKSVDKYFNEIENKKWDRLLRG